MKTKIYIIIGLVTVLPFIAVLLFSTPKAQTEEVISRSDELNIRIEQRSQEYSEEAVFAARGRIAQERMKILHFQNNLDRSELTTLEGNLL